MSMFQYDGLHLLIDAICENKEALNNPNSVIECLEAIVNDIGMTMILPPVTVKFPHAFSEIDKIYHDLKIEGLENSSVAKRLSEDLKNRKSQTYGYSSFVVIAESHISIHTFPEANFFSFDCYSCKKFDHQKVVNHLESFFGITRRSVNLVERLLP